MPDMVEDLALMREDADVLLQQAEAAQAAVGPVEKSDQSGEVVVRVDADGELQSIHVGFAWNQKLSAAELPAAVLAAFAAARVDRLEQWATAYQAVEAEPAPRARPFDETHNPVTQLREQIRASGDTSEVAGAVLEELLADIARAVEEADRILADHEAREHRGRSTAGHVTAVTLGNGDLVSVQYDSRWISGAHPGNVGRESTQAIHAAIRTAREQGLGAAMRASRLATLARRLTDQPDLTFGSKPTGPDTTAETTPEGDDS